jgi:NADH:ubiquinone oxidoreductase subunit 3 (subunit A)
MIYIGDQWAFWIFTFVELAFLSVVVLIARAIGPLKPNTTKTTIFECGNPLFDDAKNWKLTGISRYFGYAVVFFALDAFTWIVLMAAVSLKITLKLIAGVSLYLGIIIIGVGYFLLELNKLVS